MELDPASLKTLLATIHNATTPVTAPAEVVPVTTQHPAACTCHHTPATPPPAPVPARPAVQLTPGSALAVAAGGAGVVLVLGAVLVSMLLAVAITAASVAVCAVILRTLLNHHNNSTR
jgi:hypothetical protein